MPVLKLMRVHKNIKEQYARIPDAVKAFLFRAVLLIIVWKALYLLILKPANIPDAFMCQFFSRITAQTMSLFYPDCFAKGITVYVAGRPTLNILPGCNGLELIILYIGFLLCLPTTLKRMANFIVWGGISILILNYIRFVVLAYMTVQKMALTHFLHLYVFTLIVYGYIFLLWRQYTKKYGWK